MRFSRLENLEVDRVSHTVRRGSYNIDLSPKEFALLEFLMRHEGQPVSRTIVEQVWKLNFDTMTNVVDVYINYLRRKVDSGYGRALIRTIRGVGYQNGRQRPARLVGTNIDCLRETECNFHRANYF